MVSCNDELKTLLMENNISYRMLANDLGCSVSYIRKLMSHPLSPWFEERFKNAIERVNSLRQRKQFKNESYDLKEE